MRSKRSEVLEDQAVSVLSDGSGAPVPDVPMVPPTCVDTFPHHHILQFSFGRYASWTRYKKNSGAVLVNELMRSDELERGQPQFLHS